jgi:DNA photolyase
MDTAIVLFTRDLRVHDNPPPAGGCARARQVVPLFVVDPALDVPPNRARFLAESVAALREELRGLGGDQPWKLPAARRGQLRYPRSSPTGAERGRGLGLTRVTVNTQECADAELV